jgi:hypothetical protein
MRVDGAIILDILNLSRRFFKFGMERSNSQVLISRVTGNQVCRWAGTVLARIDVEKSASHHLS